MACPPGGNFHVAAGQRLSNVSGRSAGQRDQALAIGALQPFVLGQHLPSRPVGLIGAGNQPGEIPVPLKIHAQQYQRERTGFIRRVHDLEFRSDDRLDAGCHRGLVKLDHAEQVVAVRQCNSRHTQFTAPGHQGLHPYSAVDQRKFTVQMQVDEGHETARTGAKLRR